MAFYGDPDTMDATAGRIEGRADDVRTAAAQLRRDIASVEWRSTAADAFRAAAEDDVQRLQAAAAALDDAAAELRAHAATVRRRLQEIADAQLAVSRWFADVGDSLADAVRSGDVLMKAPWQSWPWRPGRLPSVGDARWLDVAQDLRHRGIRL